MLLKHKHEQQHHRQCESRESQPSTKTDRIVRSLRSDENVARNEIGAVPKSENNGSFSALQSYTMEVSGNGPMYKGTWQKVPNEMMN